MLHAIVAMLPKKGTSAPDDRRPIVLLPIIYRIWAGIRAQELITWLVRVGILQKGQSAGAEYMAADFALEF